MKMKVSVIILYISKVKIHAVWYILLIVLIINLIHDGPFQGCSPMVASERWTSLEQYQTILLYLIFKNLVHYRLYLRSICQTKL